MRWNPVLGDLGDGPVRKFHDWYQSAVASGIQLPERAALATATVAARPSVRFVLVRGYDSEGLVFFTDYNSRKGDELKANPVAALAIHWRRLGLQVRVEGRVERVASELSERYFDSRPAGNRAVAIASQQSQVVAGYDEMRQALEEQLAHGEEMLKRPKNWGGYRLCPDRFEFWTEQPHRLHERELWTCQEGEWKHCLLAP